MVLWCHVIILWRCGISFSGDSRQILNTFDCVVNHIKLQNAHAWQEDISFGKEFK